MLELNLTRLVIGQQNAQPVKVASKKNARIPPDVIHRRKAGRRVFKDARREEIAIEHMLRLPAPGESFHFVIDGRYEPCDLVPAIRRLSHPAVIKRLEITTLGFNSDNIACVINGMDQGKIESVLLVCSHYFQKADRELFELAKTEIEKRDGEVHGLRTHTKLFLLEMSDGNHYVIEGSGNMRSCKSIEQFCLTNDRDLLLFHRNWLADYITSTGKK